MKLTPDTRYREESAFVPSTFPAGRRKGMRKGSSTKMAMRFAALIGQGLMVDRTQKKTTHKLKRTEIE